MLAVTHIWSVDTSAIAPVLVSAAVCDDQIGAGLQRIDLRDDAVERRAHRGVVELALRLVDLGLGLQVERMLGGGNVGIAGELGELHLRLLPQRLRACSCRPASVKRAWS